VWVNIVSRFRLSVTAKGEDYEAIVIGAGPAGLTAALYLARYGVKVVVVSKDIGGRMAIAPLIEDYPGVEPIPGAKLVEMFVQQLQRYGVPIVLDEVVDLRKEGERWCAYTVSDRRLCGYAVILAIGCRKRKLGVVGEDRLLGRGVSYCATCDGPLFRGKVVAVIGGGNAALTSALYLASIASRVYLVHRRREFRAFPIYVEKVRSNPKIELVLESVVTEIIGKDRVEGIKVKNVVSGEERVIAVDGVFIEIGSEPPTEFLKKIGIEVDEKGYAVVKPDRSTNLEGVFAAGDVAGGPYKYRFEQIVTAVADGAIAADAAFKYLLRFRR